MQRSATSSARRGSSPRSSSRWSPMSVTTQLSLASSARRPKTRLLASRVELAGFIFECNLCQCCTFQCCTFRQSSIGSVPNHPVQWKIQGGSDLRLIIRVPVIFSWRCSMGEKNFPVINHSIPSTLSLNSIAPWLCPGSAACTSPCAALRVPQWLTFFQLHNYYETVSASRRGRFL